MKLNIYTQLKILFKDAYNIGQNAKSKTSTEFDKKTALICITVALCLAIINFYATLGTTGNKIIAQYISELFTNSTFILKDDTLPPLIAWVIIVIFMFVVVPIFLLKFIFKDNLSDYGLSLKGIKQDLTLYIQMYLIALPVLIYLSKSESFQMRYPFYKIYYSQYIFPNFILWEVLYMLHFFALEFFFRGFMVHGLKKQLGYYSIFVMSIPYCMIHFQKPFPEAISAIFGGILLGALSLKRGSIFLGWLLHCSIALTMDIAVLSNHLLI